MKEARAFAFICSATDRKLLGDAVGDEKVVNAGLPLIDWIRAGKLSHRDLLTGEFPVWEVARAKAASHEPGAIKTLLRF